MKPRNTLLPGLTAAILTVCLLNHRVAAQGRAPADTSKVAPAISFAVQPFEPGDVRLLPGPFRRAMVTDGKYLMRLQPDRLLSGFRSEAGLKPNAEKYGGWESTGLAGHTLGHYLSACSRMYQDTGDKRFLFRVQYIVGQLAECQKANGNGYVAAIPNGKKLFGDLAKGEIKAEGFSLNGGWSPWYTIHKELAGLIDSYRFCHDVQALVVATNLANWVEATTKNLSKAQWQKMLICEYGGMNEALANLYGLTGNRTYLDLAEKFYDDAVLAPLAAGRDDLSYKHDNTQIPKIVGAARLYELTDQQRYARLARFFWQRVALHRSYVIGGSGDDEGFFPTNQWADHLNASACETCCTYNMLKLTLHLFQWTPSASDMDFYERALYNDILASQDPETGMFVYLMSLEPGGFRTYSTPFESFWCCVGTGMENHTRYGQAIYFHGADSLYVNLFIPSTLTWTNKGLVVRQDTKFPDQDTTRLTFECRQPVKLALKIRWPGWAKSAIGIEVNGKAQTVEGHPASYVTVDREWHNGDTVNIHLPMSLHAVPLPGTTNILSVLYGPIVLAGELGTNDMPASVYAKDQTKFAHWPVPRVPGFVTRPGALLQHIKATGKPLTFRTENLGRPHDVTLVPFDRVQHQRYSVYWDVYTEAGWKAHEAARKAELQRQKELDARTVDRVLPGEEPSESNHHVQGERSDPVEALGRSLRHAYNGGWFSYDVVVPTNAPADLIVTYWGGEAGRRTFDILVDGKRIATQSLHRNRPGKFWDKDYPLPVALTRGKSKVTIKFQAHPDNYAGGVFGLRIVKRTPEAPVTQAQRLH